MMKYPIFSKLRLDYGHAPPPLRDTHRHTPTHLLERVKEEKEKR